MSDWITLNGYHIYIGDFKRYSENFYQKQTKENHKGKELLEKISNVNDEKAITKLKEYENLIKYEKGENAIVITKNGEIYRCFGTTNFVWPTKDINPNDILYMTHNHIINKGENSFGADDRNTFYKNNNIRVLRCIDDKYIYEFTRLNTKVNETPSINDIGEMRHAESIKYAQKEGWGYTREERKKYNKTKYFF